MNFQFVLNGQGGAAELLNAILLEANQRHDEQRRLRQNDRCFDLIDEAESLGNLIVGNRENNKPNLREILNEAKPIIGEFNPEELVKLLQAASNLQVKDEELGSLIAEEIKNRVQDFSTVDLVRILSAFAKLDISKDTQLCRLIVEKLKENGVEDLNISHRHVWLFSEAAWSLAIFDIRDEELFTPLAQQAETRSSLSDIDFTLLAYAYTKLQIHNRSLFFILIEQAKIRRAQLEPQSVAIISWALANFFAVFSEVKEEELIVNLIDEIEGVYGQFTSRDLPRVAVALALFPIKRERVVRLIAQRIKEQLTNFTSGDLADTLLAFIQLNSLDKELFTLILQCKEKLACFIEESKDFSLLVNLAKALSQLQDHRKESIFIFEAIKQKMSTSIHDWKEKNLEILVQAFDQMGIEQNFYSGAYHLHKSLCTSYLHPQFIDLRMQFLS